MKDLEGQFLKGRTGTVLNPRILERIYGVMSRTNTDGWSLKKLATEIGIHRSTLRRYLTSEVWAEIKKRRFIALADEEMMLLDKSIFQRAIDGDLKAAKLVYERWDKVRAQKAVGSNVEDLTEGDSIEAVEASLEALRAELSVLEQEKDQ